ncbi:caspase domain-containing protein [Mycena latifolia]|nr:caspase domain-containing protein [Mycena latifolia]
MDLTHGSYAQRASEVQLPIPESPSGTSRRKALLIGIRTDMSGRYPKLKAAHANVDKMRALLINMYHYDPADICVLLDNDFDGNVQPTRANILQAIRELVKDVKDGDHLFFYYGGHSTQVDNRSNSEDDGKDECLVPFFDEETSNNELRDALVKPLPASAHLVAVLDTWNSAPEPDTPGSYFPLPLKFNRMYAGLPHHHCNRVALPWVLRGKRTSGDVRDSVARRNARLLSLDGVLRHNASPARCHTRRSIISTMCDPQAPLSRPFVRARSTRIGSLVPSPKNGNVDALTQFAGPTWFLPANRRCESPARNFACDGWCRENADTYEPAADVILLSSCQDLQPGCKNDGRKSMTSELVAILQENPNRSLKEVLERVSHATYKMAVARHESAKEQKRARKQHVRRLLHQIAGLERGRRSTPSLVHSELPALVRTRTFPPARKSLAARMADTLAKLKQRLRDSPLLGGHDMDAFQNPELASARPLDMERPWQM